MRLNGPGIKHMLQESIPEYPKNLNEDYITITPACEAQLVEIMQGADEEFTALRVFVEGGGCNGLTYGMTYVEEPTEYDSVLQCEGFKLVVDAITLNFLRGCKIGYEQQGANEVFVFHNVFKSVGGSGMCSGCGGSGY